MGFFRDFVRQRVYAKREADHERKLAELKPSFDAWIRSKEEGLPYVDMTVSGERNGFDPEAEYAAREGAISFRIVPMSRCGKGFSPTAYIEDIIVFCNGELSDSALSLMAEYFGSHDKCLILTGDEVLLSTALINTSEAPKPGVTLSKYSMASTKVLLSSSGSTLVMSANI